MTDNTLTVRHIHTIQRAMAHKASGGLPLPQAAGRPIVTRGMRALLDGGYLRRVGDRVLATERGQKVAGGER